ncbi:MAG: NADP transhydrogenase subunit alpha [Bdellovibrionales bacterium CG11_big_fil_rev_8_21_14_0_20_38_13]|nr:MAG: NADP transhydrogenase subunit alpha [Bdellovibrionales bacterium CG22_combo_CG10-13_8_21_14_all_38_13]PIR29823.1 MAG: NADP transhydrogenase subunit alpha [Bdellovibrionales bacterium CG11_big_fil_rev_8_21_14_0_20_38_13]
MKQKMAIIGTGVAGMGIAHFMQDKYDLTIYEKNEYIGGHTNTIFLSPEETGEKEMIKLDTGFMVFNEVTYPNLLKLFSAIDQEYVDTDMGFSVAIPQINLEYNGSSLNGLFAQRKNIFNPKFIKMLLQIKRFFDVGLEVLTDEQFDKMSVSDYLKYRKFHPDMMKQFLTPMASAVWSTPPDLMGAFPVKSLVRFMQNHGLMGVNSQYQWKTPKDRSWSYRDKLIAPFKDNIRVADPVESVAKMGEKVRIRSRSGEAEYDFVVFASHADETRKMLKDPTPLQKELLSPFEYQKNIATVHTDTSVMPKLKRNWSSWNYIIRGNPEGMEDAFTVYWMNKLQGVSDHQDYFININGEQHVDPKKILRTIEYYHPLFDTEAALAQRRLHDLNRADDPFYFCGSYFRFGFHEDALASSVDLAEIILGHSPWQ